MAHHVGPRIDRATLRNREEGSIRPVSGRRSLLARTRRSSSSVGVGGSACRGGGRRPILHSAEVPPGAGLPRLGPPAQRERTVSMPRTAWLGLLASFTAVTMASMPATAQQPQKPNIILI